MVTPEQREFRFEWLAALRSEVYVQGQNAMFPDTPSWYTSPKMCCLGVAYLKAEPEKATTAISNRVEYSNLTTDPYAVVRERLGITEGFMRQLVRKNDMEAWTFSQIADFAELAFRSGEGDADRGYNV